MRTWKVSVGSMPSVPWPARVSIPLPARADVSRGFCVRRPDGSAVPAQWRPLVPWPDGSPRWVQLDFQAIGSGEHVVQPGAGEPAIVQPLSVQRKGTAITVAVGRLQVVFDPGEACPVRKVAWAGRDLTEGPAPWAFTAQDESGQAFDLAPGDPQSVRVEAEGTQRFQVAWQAEHRDPRGNPLLRVRFRLEFLAGVEGFALTYQFFHVLPGREFLRIRSIGVRFSFEPMAGGSAAVVQQSHGLLGSRRVARVRHSVPIRLDRTLKAPYVEDLATIADDVAYPYFLEGHAHAVGSAVALEDGPAGVVCVMEDFENQRPKQLTVRPGEVAFAIWPEWAGTLSMPQGRSASQRFCFLFADGSGAVDDRLKVPAACHLRPAAGWLAAGDSLDAGPTWDAPRLFTGQEPGAGLFSWLLAGATSRLSSVAEMFHFGDSPQGGYTISYAGLVERVPGGGYRAGTQGPIPFLVGGNGVHTGLRPLTDMEPVWCNNEYDAIYCLALEALRTQTGAVLEKLRAAARHQIEVDFVHYSDHWQHHRGTPCHTHDHVVNSTAYPSHQWTQGLYYYYCLMGDDDVPEVVRAICDYNIRWLGRPDLQHVHYFNRELGWGALALVFGYECTGDRRYIEAAREVIEELAGFASKEDFAELTKSAASIAPSNKDLLGRAFAVNTIPLAVKAYHQATGEDWARELLVQWVDYGMPGYNDRASGPKISELFPESLCYVCELTGDMRYLEESLWHLHAFMLGYAPACWASTGTNEMLDGKLYGRVYRGLVMYLSACAKAGLLKGAEDRLLGTHGRSC